MTRDELILEWRAMSNNGRRAWMNEKIGRSWDATVIEHMHAMEEFMPREMRTPYALELHRIVGGEEAKTVGERYFLLAHASPAQRALAAYLTLEMAKVEQ